MFAHLTRRRLGTSPDALGVVAVWWFVALLVSLIAPGTSYLFVWPSLAGGLALLCRPSRSSQTYWDVVCWALVSVTTLVVLVPAIDFFFQFAQPRPGNPDSQMLAIIAIPTMLVSLVVELLRAFRVRLVSKI